MAVAFFMIAHQKKYYWFGTTQKQGGAWLSEGINCYSSYDLATWTFENEVFHNTSIKVSTHGPYRIERPKVLFNEKTKKYVMWFHLDDSGFSLRMVGVAESSTITGNYNWVAGFRPDGEDSYDMTLYQDDDGSAYLCRSVRNQFAGISKLTDDYMNTTGIISKGPQIEGQAIFKIYGKYYLTGSHLTGWNPNQAVLCTTDSRSLSGATWQNLPPMTSDQTTYNSQSTYVLPYLHPSGSLLYIFLADRWAYPKVDQASYVWLPLVVNSVTDIKLIWHDQWTIKDF